MQMPGIHIETIHNPRATRTPRSTGHAGSRRDSAAASWPRRTAQAMNDLDQLRALMASRPRLLQALGLADDVVDVVAGARVHVHGVVAQRTHVVQIRALVCASDV
jgi:hypothetical protein